jgi:hypothetical protein
MLSIWSDFLVPRAGKLQSLRLCGNLCNGTAVARWSMRLKRNEANTQFGSDDDALELFGGKGFRTQPRQALASEPGHARLTCSLGSTSLAAPPGGSLFKAKLLCV